MQTPDGSLEFIDGSDLTNVLQTYQTLAAAASLPSKDPDVREIEAYKSTKTYLTHISQQLAQRAHQRLSFTSSGLLSATIEALSSLYTVFERVQAARPSSSAAEADELQSNAPSIDTKEQQRDPYYRISFIATLYLRIARNAMAGCADAQALLCHRFELVAPFLANITRFHTLNDPDTLLLSRSAVQMLSNMITANREVQRQMWTRVVTTDREEDKLVLKFLSSPDTATQSAAQVLLINFLRTPSWAEDADERCYELCSTTAGLQLIQSLLSSSESIMLRTASATQDEPSQKYEPESEIEGLEESLGFIYTIFAILFESGYSSLLVSTLAPIVEISSSSSMQSDLPIVSSSQLTLLKLLDSWLHLNQKQVAESSSSTAEAHNASKRPTISWSPALASRPIERNALNGAGLAGLVDIFMQLSVFARSAMSSGMAKDGVPADQQPQDRRLFGVHHGLLLLLQSLLSISLTMGGARPLYR